MSENAEFDKWWQHWIATVAESWTVVKHPASGNKPGDAVIPKLNHSEDKHSMDQRTVFHIIGG